MIPDNSHPNRFAARMAAGLMPALALAVVCLWSSSAAADFRLCNNTSSRVGIALGYKDAEGWTTEGWWNVSSRACETLLRGTLVARFYYIYALDYDRGGEWSGQAFMCSRDKEFTIKGTENCLARGFDRTGFFEADTGEQRAWTVQLTESSEQAGQRGAGIPGTDRPRGCLAARQPQPPGPSHETPAPYQDPRHARPGFLRQRHDQAAVRGRRRRLPHQYEPYLARQDARTGQDHSQRRIELRPADRDSGRSPGAEAAAGIVRRGRDPAQERRKLRARFGQGPGRQQPRPASASGNSRRAEAGSCAVAR